MLDPITQGTYTTLDKIPKYHCSAEGTPSILNIPLNILGAVLADEMGLGKTLEVISLILASPQKEEEFEHKDIDPKQEYFHTPATLGNLFLLSPSEAQ